MAPEYHPKIIGRKGAVITKLRDDFKVNIQLPKKEGDSQEEITITGLEENAEAAKNEILKIVGQYESMVKMEVNIDAKVHSMIIGRGGKSIRNIMEKYKVDIRLPRAGDEDPTLVVVSGDQDACEDCIDHLKIMEEDFIQEAAEQDWERDYLKPTRQVENKESNKKKDGFMVSKAPWDVSSAEAFPSLGGGGGGQYIIQDPAVLHNTKFPSHCFCFFEIFSFILTCSFLIHYLFTISFIHSGGASSAPTAWGPKTGRR